MSKSQITIETTVNAPISKVWDYWNNPEHVSHWAFASDEWAAEGKKNDLRVGGSFVTTMFAKDKSASFDFGGTYTTVETNKLIEYVMTEAGRHVKVMFEEVSSGVKIIESFDPEEENSEEKQRQGWQAILDNFKKYVESNQ